MTRRNGRWKDRWDEGLRGMPTRGCGSGSRGRFPVDEDESAMAQPSSHHPYHTRPERNPFSQPYRGGSQPRGQPYTPRPSVFDRVYEPSDYDGKGNGRGGKSYGYQARHGPKTYTYRDGTEPVSIPAAKARQDSSSSLSSDGGSPPYFPPGPSSPPSSTNIPPCAYCLETRRTQADLVAQVDQMQGDLMTQVNHLAEAFVHVITGLNEWAAGQDAVNSDEMDWEHDATTVIYYRNGILGYRYEQRTVPPEHMRREEARTQAGPADARGMDYFSALSHAQRILAASRLGDSLASIIGLQTAGGVGYSGLGTEDGGLAGGQYHDDGLSADRRAQSQPPGTSGRGYKAPTVEDKDEELF